MFGKHNKIQQNKEIINEALESSERSEWQKAMDEVPAFDQHLAEMSAETKEKVFDVESLKEVSGFSERLKELGANQAIISNPAFKRALDGILRESGLKYGANLEELASNNHSFGLDCERDKNLSMGSWQHDHSNFRIDVEKNGNFTIDYAYVDRDEMTMGLDGLDYAKITPNAKEVAAFNDINSSHRLKFIKQSQNDGFNIESLDIYEEQLSPQSDSKNLKAGIYYEAASKSTRCFNVEGTETYRETTEYQPVNLKNINSLVAFIRPDSAWGEKSKPTNASFNILDHLSFFRSDSEWKSFISYSRNPDGKTVKIKGRDGEGEFASDSVPLNTQYGASDIIISNGVNIQDLRSETAD